MKKITSETSDTKEVSASEYHERVLALLGHLERVIDSPNFQRIDTNLWNAVTTVEPEIVYSE
jgi:hypothetical protein